MKTEMRIKTGRASENNAVRDEPVKAGTRIENVWTNKRPLIGARMGICVLLLMALAVGGYAGAFPKQVQTTAAPITARTMSVSEATSMTYEEICARQDADRQNEIVLLDSIIQDEKTDESTRNSAIAQKAQIVGRMETESALRAALAHMGFEQVAVMSGAGQITLIVPEGAIREDDDVLRMVDASAACAQVQARDVKIILVKK